ncbi:aminotransferase class V-fold PLP-dependent enzyme [Desulfosporosinus burensis]
MQQYPFTEFRKRFPILKNQIQLSSCSQSALSDPVQKAVQEYMATWEEHGMEWVAWVDTVEEARADFATLINADINEIAVVSSVSHAASSIATSLSFDQRNKVVVTEMDFPCIGHVWLSQQARGAKLEFIASENNQIPLEKYESMVDENTLLTSIPQVTYYNGFQQDVKQIAEIVHRKGSYLFVDAYQSVGNVLLDVREMDIDFLATGLQKYLLGIPGIAFLYIKREIADQLEPRITGWFGQSNPFLFDVTHLEYAAGARRFDSGTAPMINAYAARAALRFILEVGMERIAPYLKELSAFAIQYAEEKGVKIISPTNHAQKGSNTAIYVENAGEVEQKMKEKGVIVSSRKNVIRIAPHFYNTKEDIATAMDLLTNLIR